MNKLIIVHYIDSRKMSPQDIEENIQAIIKNINLNDDYLAYFIPIESETRIECINPKLVSEEDYRQAREILDRNQKIVDDISKSNKSHKLPRYFVDIRGGCGAVRDRWHESYDEDYQGLHSDTPDVVEYKHGYQDNKTWNMKEDDIKYLHDLCNKLNNS